MKIKTATIENSELDELMNVWEASVRATHHFLTDEDISIIRPQVRQALTAINNVMYCVDGGGSISGFMAVEDGKIEMLFIHPAHRGGGIGGKFVHHAVDVLKAEFVDVNEQNTSAVGFYKHLGFSVVGRSPLDGSGNPFPVLHMSRCR